MANKPPSRITRMSQLRQYFRPDARAPEFAALSIIRYGTEAALHKHLVGLPGETIISMQQLKSEDDRKTTKRIAKNFAFM
jgi:hypothetical protein